MRNTQSFVIKWLALVVLGVALLSHHRKTTVTAQDESQFATIAGRTSLAAVVPDLETSLL